MNRSAILAILLAGIFFPAIIIAQIPVNPNQTDEQGKRQGKWTILFDKDWKIVEASGQAEYYAMITYQADGITGDVKYYFKNRKYITGGRRIMETWKDLNEEGLVWHGFGMYEYALPFFEIGKIRAAYEFGKKHLNYAVALDNLATSCRLLENYTQAEPLCLESKEIRENVLGKWHPDYTVALNNLALLYNDMGFYTKAEPLFLEAKEIIEMSLGKKNPAYATTLSNLATLYSNMSNYSKAEPLFLEAKEIGAAVLGKQHPDYASCLNNLGLLYQKMGNNLKAEPLYQEALEIRVLELTISHPDLVHSYNNLASLYSAMGNYSKAVPLYQSAKQEVGSRGEKEHPDYAASLDNLALAYVNMKNYLQAEPLYLEAKEIREKVLGKEHPAYVNSLNNLDALYRAMGSLSKSGGQIPINPNKKDEQGKRQGKWTILFDQNWKPVANWDSLAYYRIIEYRDDKPDGITWDYYKDGKIKWEGILLTDRPKDVIDYSKPTHYFKEDGTEDHAPSLFNLARHQLTLGDYSKAEALCIEAKEIQARVFGKGHPEYAICLNNLASIYQAIGNYSKAESFFVEGSEIIAKVLGKEHPQYAASRNSLAMLYLEMGNYAKAEPLYIEAQEIQARVLGKEHPDYAGSLNNLGSFYKAIGDYTKAEPLYVEATLIRKKVLGKEHPDFSSSLNNLASLYKDMGDFPNAERLYLASIQIFERVYGRLSPAYLSSTNNLALLYQAMGSYSKAEPLYLAVKEIQTWFLGKEHPDYALTLNNLATLYTETENYPKAVPLLQEAMGVFGKSLGKEHPNYVSSLNNTAMVYEVMGDYTTAEPLYLEAISKKKEQIIRDFPSLSEKEKQNFYSLNKFFFSNFENYCLERCAQNPNIQSEMYNQRLFSKGLLFNASNKIRQRILNSKNQSLIDLFNQWQSKKNILAKIYQMSLIEKQNTGIDEKKFEAEVNSIEKELSLKSELFSSGADKKQYQWGDVRQKLKNGETAIEIVRAFKKNGAVAYAALIVTSQTYFHPDIVVLENGADLEGKFSKYYRNAIKQKVKDEISYNQYWKPIADKLKGIKKVYFSADGVYNQINLNTLYNPATGKYVIDEMEVQVVTSTKDLVTNVKSAKTAIKDATLFGYPNYNNSKTSKPDSSRTLWNSVEAKTTEMKTDSTQRFFNGENISELPGTKAEVEIIEALLSKKNISMHEYMYDRATEAEIKKLNNPQVLHIATHGFFLSDLPPPKENERGFAGMETKKIAENPLLRSGLLFAGAKNAFDEIKRNEGGEDGILTAYEAMSLDLDQTDLIVMSACETGLGVTSNGEGVYGLQRAFQVAGAKSVLMSLWTVSDEATQQLMILFYENWLSGKTPREAFHMAQLSLREKYPEPFYWGAFVLVGE